MTSEKTDDGADLAADLRRALERGELSAHFQPQYELGTGRLIGLEALCRWQHPEHGQVPPDRFIPVAEKFDLIDQLGRYMLEWSAPRAAEWFERGVPVALALNVSPTELTDGFAHGVIERLNALGLPPERVTLEITESPALRESDAEYVALTELVEAGVGVSIDDFGAGFTSLDALRRLPYTEVKIDRSLILDENPHTDDLAIACVSIAHSRGAHVVAEGIETPAQLERARSWGCDRGQGYLFAPPLADFELEPVLAGATAAG